MRARELGRPGSELIKIHGVHAGWRANETNECRHATNNVFNQTTEPQICALTLLARSVRHERTNSKRMHLIYTRPGQVESASD